MILDGLIDRRDGREVLTFDVDADAPRYGSIHPSPLGVALCTFSDLPADVGEVAHRLAETETQTVPPFYRRVADWLDSADARGQWLLSHFIDNDLLFIAPELPSGRPLSRHLADLAGHPSIQTDSRRLTFLAADRTRLVDFDWDSECFAVYYHGSASAVASFFGLTLPESIEFNRDGSMMWDCARACQWGGGPFEEFLALDARYDLHPHEWRQLQVWLGRGVTSAAEVLTAQETVGRIDHLLNGRPVG